MDYGLAFERRDIARIDKLNSLTNLDTFYDDVRKFTRRITSDHSIHCWERLSELRWMELKGEQDPEWLDAMHDPDLLMKKMDECNPERSETC